ncbi:MAG: RhuM family protein [Petrimonas sp.]|nr:RhuM family protein [Petrimonas sp.]
MNNQNEIVIYQADESFQMEVRWEDETVWLTLNQLSNLFDRDKSVVSRHIRNIFKENELNRVSVVAKNATTAADGKVYQVEYYNLDVIISVGYRVKSQRGTQFRIWANKILKDYLLKGYAVNQRLEHIERRLYDHDQKFDLLIKTSLPPSYGIFFEGQIFDAYKFVADLIKSAKKNIILIDNYVDESVLFMLSKRKQNVSATIFTNKISKQLQLDVDKFNAQYAPIAVKLFTKSHDRFLILDNTEVYHIGASLKDLGKKWFAFSKIGLNAKEIIEKLT